MKPSKYKYTKEHKAQALRRSSCLQVSSADAKKVLQKRIKHENEEVDDFLWYLVSKNRDKNQNPKIKSIHTKVNKRFEWGKMDNEEVNATSLWWIATDGGRQRWVTIKKSCIESTVTGKDIRYGLFAARDFDKD